MAYFTEEELADHMGYGTLSGAVLYGGTPTARTGSIIEAKMAQSSDYVDSFLKAAGYTVPLTTVPSNIKMIALNHCKMQMQLRGNVPVTQDLRSEVGYGESYLLDLSKGKAILPGVEPETDGAVQGGHLFPAGNDAVGNENTIVNTYFDADSLKNF